MDGNVILQSGCHLFLITLKADKRWRSSKLELSRKTISQLTNHSFMSNNYNFRVYNFKFQFKFQSNNSRSTFPFRFPFFGPAFPRGLCPNLAPPPNWAPAQTNGPHSFPHFFASPPQSADKEGRPRVSSPSFLLLTHNHQSGKSGQSVNFCWAL